MSIKKVFSKLVPNFILARLGIADGIGKFTFDTQNNVKKDIKKKYGFDGDLLDIYASNKGQVVHKWHHYIPIYDQYFSRYRGKKIRFLEIGVSKGGSLNIWRQYFGLDAIIYGIDIDPECSKYNGISGQVRIGSQGDINFLDSVIKEMGGIDIVLDDGSHRMTDVLKSFKNLFPKLNDNGLYLVEDLHTAYWREYGGGFQSKRSFFNFISDLTNDMHHWYHKNAIKYPEIIEYCSGMHIHDSIVVFEKQQSHEPRHSQIG